MNNKSFYFMINLFCNIPIIKLIYNCLDFNKFFYWFHVYRVMVCICSS